MFGSTVTAYSYVADADNSGAHVKLVTRETRYLAAPVAAGSYTVPLAQYGMVTLTWNFAGDATFDATVPPTGARSLIYITNDDGSNRQFTPSSPFWPGTPATINAGTSNALDCISTVRESGANAEVLVSHWID